MEAEKFRTAELLEMLEGCRKECWVAFLGSVYRVKNGKHHELIIWYLTSGQFEYRLMEEQVFWLIDLGLVWTTKEAAESCLKAIKSA